MTPVLKISSATLRTPVVRINSLTRNRPVYFIPSLAFQEKQLTSELTRRRESKHPSPHQASCERRSRRSRPTICSVSPPVEGANLLPCGPQSVDGSLK